MPLSQQFMDNPRADRVRRVASLRQASVRRREGKFLIEGPQAVREAVSCLPGIVTDVYIDPSADPNDDIIEAALAAPNPIYVHKVSTQVLARMSPDAQSVAAIGLSKDFGGSLADFALSDGSATSDSEACIGADADTQVGALKGSVPLIAACWQVRDPGNEGTLIRTADAAGFDALVLVDDCVHPLNPKVIRSTAGSLFHIPVLQAGTDEFFDWAAAHHADVWAADIHGTPEQAPYDLSTLVYGRATSASSASAGTGSTGDEGRLLAVSGRTAPLALLFGNEARGLPTDIVARADASVMIPIYGKAESLNLAMSGAVLMYTLAMAAHAQG
jgi:TrmH family RNA methyltransferase